MDGHRNDPYHGLRSRDDVARDQDLPHCSRQTENVDAKRSNRHEGFVNLSKSLAKLGGLPYHGLPQTRGRSFATGSRQGLRSNREEKTKRLTVGYGLRSLAGRPGRKAGFAGLV